MKKKSALRIDDRTAHAIESARHDLEPFVGKEALDAAIAAVPVVGSVILAVANDISTRRSFERAIELFRLMKEDFERLDEAKLDKEFFKTEEFQTLLFLALEQLRTTHDKEKQRMLAAALTKSGVADFSSEERKELFMRIIRDLSPQHIRILKSLVPEERSKGIIHSAWPKECNPTGELLALVQYLSAVGLVEEFLDYDQTRSFPSPRFGGQWSEHEAIRAIKEYVNVPPKREFRISQFGLDFLHFMGD